MRKAIQRKWRRLTGWAALGLWFAFGASCTSQERSAARTVVDIVRAFCSPLQTVDECVNVILAEPKSADAGTE